MTSLALVPAYATVAESLEHADFRGRRIHMVGIGGSGMCGLAGVLLHGGARVSGSDARMSITLARLATAGARILTAESLPADAELVVASAAIPESHPELVAAAARGVPLLRYAEMLGVVMKFKQGVAISGTHGKSTTTAWLAFVLREAGFAPSYVVGAGVEQLGGSSGAGEGQHFVVEACEFNRSFLNMHPTFAAILNVEADHLDYYSDLDEIVSAFREFADTVHPAGLLVINGDDPACRRVIGRRRPNVETFGFGERNTWRADNLALSGGCYSFDVLREAEPSDPAGSEPGRYAMLGRVTLRVAGRHNVMNSLAVIALATRLGVSWPILRSVIGEFAGARRRLEQRGVVNGIRVVDDYAHHPSEIRATLAAARERFSPRRIWAVFQPHQYSRTRALADSFATAFADADRVLLPEIFAARDSAADRAAINAAGLAARIRAAGVEALHIADFDAIIDHVAQHAEPGDLVLTMGAGNIGKVADDLVQRLGGDLPA